MGNIFSPVCLLSRSRHNRSKTVGSYYDSEGVKERIERRTREIIDEVKDIYKKKLLPVELQYGFGDVYSPSWTDGDFTSKPMVFIVGQYSTGKTTFIKYLLDGDFPGCNIGPEPTTDKFVAAMYGKAPCVIPGYALTADTTRPFVSLTKFGSGFLNRFEASIFPSPLLKDVTIIDTPGILSGKKQVISRSYDFPLVAQWFAERSDRILLIFDAHKLDISDEFKYVITMLSGNQDKVRCILNKADLPNSDLLRVYGALMWSLGKIIKSPEAMRIYIGSFWSRPMQNEHSKILSQAEKRDLVTDLRTLPHNSTARRINELLKRVRNCRIHAHVLSHLRDQFGWFNKTFKQEQLRINLGDHMQKVQEKTSIPKDDFPSISDFQKIFTKNEIWKFPRLNPKSIEDINSLLNVDVPRLLKQWEIVRKEANARMFSDSSKPNPFADDVKTDVAELPWVIDNYLKSQYDNQFLALQLNYAQKLTAREAREALLRTGTSSVILHNIWEVADLDKDGMLDSAEYAVAMYLIDQYKAGKITAIPRELEPHWVPPSKRHLFNWVQESMEEELVQEQ